MVGSVGVVGYANAVPGDGASHRGNEDFYGFGLVG